MYRFTVSIVWQQRAVPALIVATEGSGSDCTGAHGHETDANLVSSLLEGKAKQTSVFPQNREAKNPS